VKNRVCSYISSFGLAAVISGVERLGRIRRSGLSSSFSKLKETPKGFFASKTLFEYRRLSIFSFCNLLGVEHETTLFVFIRFFRNSDAGPCFVCAGK
jgi:hypothetical protein